MCSTALTKSFRSNTKLFHVLSIFIDILHAWHDILLNIFSRLTSKIYYFFQHGRYLIFFLIFFFFFQRKVLKAFCAQSTCYVPFHSCLFNLNCKVKCQSDFFHCISMSGILPALAYGKATILSRFQQCMGSNSFKTASVFFESSFYTHVKQSCLSRGYFFLKKRILNDYLLESPFV